MLQSAQLLYLQRYRGLKDRRQPPIRTSPRHLAFGVAFLVAGSLTVSHVLPSNASGISACKRGATSTQRGGAPTAKLAWRAGLLGRTSVYRGVPGNGGRRRGAIAPRESPWLLVLRTVRDRGGRCWVKVRLPSRPNSATGWLHAGRVLLRPTRWSVLVSRARRTLAVYRGGELARKVRIVVGAPGTPTPKGLFSIVGAWRGNPDEFTGSWILGLTAHSNVLQEFGGGEGRVGIHGRGGASLADPLGSAASHGCIRLANPAIEWLVRAVGHNALPGIPVRVR